MFPAPDLPHVFCAPVSAVRSSATLMPWIVAAALGVATLGGRAAEDGWETHAGYRSAPLRLPAKASPPTVGLRRLPPESTGVGFTNRLTDVAIAENRLREIGAGVALGDVDGDGRVDIFLCGSEGDNALYRNRGGFQFEDITARAGVAGPGPYATGAALVDVEGDGDLDLFVNSLGGGTRLFVNDGNANFSEAKGRGLLSLGGATTLAFADVDGDGDLDLYVTNYRTDTMFDHPAGLKMEVRAAPDGSRVIEPRARFRTLMGPDGAPQALERGEPDAFYIHRGGGFFSLQSWTTGLFVDEDGQRLGAAPTDWGLAAMFRDLNGDGLPDLYVCNDFVFWPDRIWLNDGARRFRALPRTAMRNTSLASMAVDVADINRDGIDDLFVADMLHPSRGRRAYQRPDTMRSSLPWPLEDAAFRPEVPRNTLQVGRGDGTFAEIACFAGLAATDWTPAAAFLDVDLDGWEDLLTLAGNLHDVQDADALAALGRSATPTTVAGRLQHLARLPTRAGRSSAFRNQHDLTFADRSEAWGFDAVGVAQGLALGDLDGDGDLDVVVSAMNEGVRIYRNESSAPRVAVRLRGSQQNTRGIGARIRVQGGPVTQTQEMMAGGRFCSSDDPLRVFAAGQATELSLEVVWRGGKRSVISGVRPNRLYEIFEEAAASGAPSAVSNAAVPLFAVVETPELPRSTEPVFDDFLRQPLLPRKLSTGGPGLAWADSDGDGREELLLCGGGVAEGVALHPLDAGSFEVRNAADREGAGSAHRTTTLVWRDGARGVRRVTAESCWPLDATAFSRVRFERGRGRAEDTETLAVPRPGAAIGAMALADIDADGDLDLFVGGRTVAGRYPEGTESWVVRNEAGRFRAFEVCLTGARVNGAVFTDWDGDGDPDLALACDWDSPRFLRNDGGRFSDVTASMGIAELKGWWTGIAAGDFDGDGRMDVVIGNWGRNWRLDVEVGQEPSGVRLYYGDLGGAGGVQTVMSSFDPGSGKVTPWRERAALLAVLPSLAAAYPDHRSYGRASVEELLGSHREEWRILEAKVGEPLLLLNRGTRFEARSLPPEASFSPVLGVVAADFDGDGNEDLFLAQNFFGVDAESSRQDAGIGLVMLGAGDGRFRGLGPRESGFSIYGEQRGAAVADYDRDGRVDLAVGQHRGPLRLLRNQGAKPGLRVRFRGSGDNPDAVGASFRVRHGDRWGPRRELHLGSGWWSQNSLVQVVGGAGVPRQIEVRWPGGRVETRTVPEGNGEALVSVEGGP